MNHKTVFFQEFANVEKIEIGTPENVNQSIKLKTTEVVQALETLKWNVPMTMPTDHYMPFNALNKEKKASKHSYIKNWYLLSFLTIYLIHIYPFTIHYTLVALIL